MPISTSSKVTPDSLVTIVPPELGQVPASDGSGGFTWVDAGASSDAKLISFVTDIIRKGFVDNTETSVPYLSGTAMDIVNLDDMGSGWSYYYNGAKRTITGNKTVELTGGAENVHDDGRHYIYINTVDGTLKTKTSPFNYETDVMVASVVWDSSLDIGSQSLIGDERHSSKWDSSVHEYIHSTLGTVLDSGGALFGYTLNSDVDGDKQYNIAQSVIDDEDLSHTLDALVGGNGQYTSFHRTSPGTWGWSLNNNFPYRYSLLGRMNYDDGSATGAEIPTGKFVNTYVLHTTLIGQPRHVFITSQTYYTTSDESHGKSFKDLDLTGFPIDEYYISHKITWSVLDTLSSTGKCVIEKVVSYGGSSKDLTPNDIGSPSLVEDSVINNLVGFSTTTGQQKDSGFSPSSFQLASGKNAANGYAGLDASKNVSLQTGGLKDANVSTAIKLGDSSNTSLATVNKTILGSINEIESELSYLSAGVFGTEPTFTDNGNGTVTIGDVDVLLYPSDDFTGTLKEYIVNGDTFTFTANAEEYVVVNYNAGTPVMQKATDITTINSSDIIMLFVVWRIGNVCHSLGFDSQGVGLSNKLQDSLFSVNLYQRTVAGGLDISETTTPNPRTILVTEASVYTGAIKQTVGPFDSSSDTMTEVVHSSSAWTYVNKLVYNNTEYDAGVNAASLGSGKYGVVWFYRSIGDAKQLFYVLGTTPYDTESLALLSQPRIDLPVILKRHCMLIGRAIILSGATSGNVQSSFAVTFNGYSPIMHNDMTNIDGTGTYHISSAEATKVTALGTISSQDATNVSLTGSLTGTVTGHSTLDLPLSGATMSANSKLVTAASVAGNSGFNVPAGTAPTVLVDGDIYYDSTQKSLVVVEAGLKHDMVGIVYSKTDDTTVTASVTNAESNLIGTGIGTGTIPANFLTVGRTLRYRASGTFIPTNNSATFIFRIKLGTSILATTATIDPTNFASALGWFVEGDFVVRTTGQSGTCRGNATLKYGTSATAFAEAPMINTTAIAIDTTISNVATPSIQYTQTTANNSLTCSTFTLEIMN